MVEHFPNWGIAPPVDLTIGSERMSPDPLLNKCLVHYPSRDNDLNAVRVGIGDPMRIASALGLPTLQEPLVIGSLINKVCLWAIDAKAHFDSRVNFKPGLDRLLVHPKGWTGYVVPFYQQVSVYKQDPEEIVTFLEPVETPGKEQEQYIRCCTSQPTEKIAYITTNPLEGKDGATDESNYQMVHNFTDDPKFNGVIMSGLIVGKPSYYKDSSVEIIDDLLNGLKNAVARIMEDPDLVASMLWTYGQILRSKGSPIFCSNWSPSQTRECITFMRDQNIFSTDLNVKGRHWEKSKKIHKVYEYYVSKPDSTRSVDSLHSGYYI